MGARNENKDAMDRLCSMLENLDGTPAEDLRLVLDNLNPNAEAEEQKFIRQLHSMRSSLEATADAELMAPQGGAANGEARLRGLISEARKRGLTSAELADAAQLSTPLVMKLDLRLIRYATIPRQVIEDVSNAIKRSAEQVALYLQGDPIRTAVVYSEADAPEELQEQQDFLDIIQADDSLSEDRRTRLLAMMAR
jgi:hypothetical protein